MRRVPRLSTLLIVTTVLGATQVIAQDEMRESLKGLTGVEVLLDGFNDAARRVGITESKFRAVIELRLRQAGIPIFTSAEGLEQPRNPLLGFTIVVLSGSAPWTYSWRLQLYQNWCEGTFCATGITWETAQVARQNEPMEDLRASLNITLDQFINDWLATHP